MTVCNPGYLEFQELLSVHDSAAFEAPVYVLENHLKRYGRTEYIQ